MFPASLAPGDKLLGERVYACRLQPPPQQAGASQPASGSVEPGRGPVLCAAAGTLNCLTNWSFSPQFGHAGGSPLVRTSASNVVAQGLQWYSCNGMAVCRKANR